MPKQAKKGGGGIAATYSKPQQYKRVGGQHQAPAALPPGKPGTNFTRK
jgi:hypothetical protein